MVEPASAARTDCGRQQPLGLNGPISRPWLVVASRPSLRRTALLRAATQAHCNPETRTYGIAHVRFAGAAFPVFPAVLVRIEVASWRCASRFHTCPGRRTGRSLQVWWMSRVRDLFRSGYADRSPRSATGRRTSSGRSWRGACWLCCARGGGAGVVTVPTVRPAWVHAFLAGAASRRGLQGYLRNLGLFVDSHVNHALT